MKKIVYSALAIGAMAVAAINLHLNAQSGLSTVVKTNVEAFSSSEKGKPGDKCYAGQYNSQVPEARYCYNHCANYEPVNENIQTCN